MKKIYLCSRVSYDARPMNNRVADALRAGGCEVYVPHEQAPNQLTQEGINEARFDVETIFRLDFGAMQQSNVCVVVGRVGKDCSFEIGWFYSRGLPIFFIPEGDETYKTSPMLLPALKEIHTVDSITDAVFEAPDYNVEAIYGATI